MTKEVFSVHMVITGEYISKMASSMYHRGYTTEIGKKYSIKDGEQKAYGFLSDLKPEPTYEQMIAIVNGEISLVGQSVCDEKGCDQCKGQVGLHIEQEPDFELKFLIEKWNNERVTNELEDEELAWDVAPNREQLIKRQRREAKEKQEEEEEKALEESLKSDAEGTITLDDKFTVSLKSLEEYKLAVEFCERATSMAMMGRPQMAIGSLDNRIRMHKQIFKEAGVVYHGEQPDHDKHPESRELYDAIEKWLEANYYDTSKKGRLESMKNQRAINDMIDGKVKKKSKRSKKKDD